MNAWTRRYCSALAALVAPLVLTTAVAQPPPAAPDRAAAERQAALNALPDSPGTGVMHNTGVLNGGPNTAIPGMDVTKDALANFHTPVIYILGGPTDIAYA